MYQSDVLCLTLIIHFLIHRIRKPLNSFLNRYSLDD